MPRTATKLTPTGNGGFVARKRIPTDVQDAYTKLYGQRWEERFNSGPMPALLARAKHREWSSEIEARFATLRAERRGEGRALAPKEARALAGEWYGWFTARMAGRKWGAEIWKQYGDHLRSELYGPAMSRGMFAGDPLDLWESDSEMRERVRPMIADWSESNQFLAAKRVTLDLPSRDLFLDFLTRDFFAALRLLMRQAKGDFGPDEWATQFPQQANVDAGFTPWALFEKWIAEVKPATSTVDRWRAVFLKLQSDFPNQNAAGLLPEQMQTWSEGLINHQRSPVTVRDVYVIACRTVFAWGIGKRLVSRNPFTGWRITVPKKIRTRETKAFTDNEIKTILSAALAVRVDSKGDAAKRWCPWLAAYSGARMGELAQLRGIDIVEHDGVHAMRISPEAGTIKTGKPRTVPLHEDLIEQGFLTFVKANGKIPLFYSDAKQPTAPNDPTNPRKPRYVKAREQVAAWVRGLGINDPELSPNHAWRHTFKAVGFRSGMSEKVLDAIVGHSPASVGRGYGEPTLEDKARELRKFPRYRITPCAD